jgi:hypothetical protein
MATEIPSKRIHFGCETPLKVQFDFDIHLIKDHIDIDALEKWLSLLEGYFFVHNFSSRENISFALLKVIIHVKY